MRTPVLLICLVLSAAAPLQAQERVRTLTRTYAFDPDGTIEITTYKGSITISPWEHAQVQIDVRIEAEDIDGLIMLPDIDIEIGGTEHQLGIETDYRKAIARLQEIFTDSDTPRLPLVHYTIQMPRTAHLQIEDYMSRTSIDDFQSSLDFYSYKGDVELTNFGGSLKLDTFRGNAQVTFRTLVWDSSIESHEGEVDVSLPIGSSFDLAVDLGAPQAIFASDTTFAELHVLERQKQLLGVRMMPPQGYNGPINGGGPRLNLVTHRGHVRLHTLN